MDGASARGPERSACASQGCGRGGRRRRGEAEWQHDMSEYQVTAEAETGYWPAYADGAAVDRYGQPVYDKGNGHAQHGGGLIVYAGGSVTLEQVVIANCTAEAEGLLSSAAAGPDGAEAGAARSAWAFQ